MSVGIWRCEYSQLYEHLSSEEILFCQNHFSESDDGTYGVDEYILKEQLEDAKKQGEEIPAKLIDTLRKAIEKEPDKILQFRIF